jgi:multidrug efflux pump subunit AcrA (membrane-fusion protein)
LKIRSKTGIVIIVAVLTAGAGAFLFREKIFPAATAASSKTSAASTTVPVSRGDISTTVTASGQFEPNLSITVRPDSNSPTRKIVRILVNAGARVAANQALAQIDATGLALSVKSAEANYKAQKAKLDNLRARPAGMDLAAAEAAMTAARTALETRQETYDNAKALADKDLGTASALKDAERQLSSAKAAYESQALSYQNVKGQSGEADIQALESALATADYDLQMAKLVLDSTIVRSPVAGTVAEILVSVGDLVGPSTSIASVADTDPMVLSVAVNENDVPSIKTGQTAIVEPTAYTDAQLTGVITHVDLHATTSNNVSVFAATIEVPNKDGKLLWGMNADATISVVSLKNVLTLPSSAVKTSNGASTVTILRGGQQVSWDVQTGATDGTRTQILAGLDEGQEVVTSRKSTTAAAASQSSGEPTPPDGGPGGLGAPGISGVLGGLMR